MKTVSIKQRITRHWKKIEDLAPHSIKMDRELVLMASIAFADPMIGAGSAPPVRQALEKMQEYTWIKKATPEIWRELGKFQGACIFQSGLCRNDYVQSNFHKMLLEANFEKYGNFNLFLAGPGFAGINWIRHFKWPINRMTMVDKSPFIVSTLKEYLYLSGRSDVEIIEEDLFDYKPEFPFNLQVWSLIFKYYNKPKRTQLLDKIKEFGRGANWTFIFFYDNIYPMLDRPLNLYKNLRAEIKGANFEVLDNNTMEGRLFFITAGIR